MRNDAERDDWNDPLEARRRLGAGRADADFASLRVWQDANEDGISDAGELKTLAELGRIPGRLLVGNWRPSEKCGHPKAHQEFIQSTSVDRTDEGHDRGFAATLTRTDGSTRRQAQSSLAALSTSNSDLGR